ncbi:hypothetical protein EW146_g4120 [Bondarzewia mesenterica]|uniref:FAD-binding PCMH-type domain-containing protein n=1 Tax=Bondarzewia mesenterica TaxID=1095465 RepID=A0A4S4LW07_9AGAM|nr:hypothetical protein EW146_g4120 [Bondarzewia mesenterica]
MRLLLATTTGLGLLEGIVLASCQQHASVASSDWEQLHQKVQGRLYEGTPFSKPCFDDHDSAECHAIVAGYSNDTFRSQYFGAYVNTNWETCQAIRNDSCLLDYTDPANIFPTLPPNRCLIGSVPQHYIDVRTHEDVAAAFDFSKKTRVPLIIKNTGHDYKGRSSAPNSLALWTHNMKNMSYDPTFVPEGCATPSPGVTVGAGVQWGEAYPFAEAHNITLVGGSDKGVGVSGGWLQGGGHGALTNTMGMGVDRVLQFKVVTPDGQYRVANACQNEDLFFALRGGGGGTFGVVLESTTLASPQVTLQVVVVTWTNPNATLTESLWSILVDNAEKWANEGWGGFVAGQSVIYITPTLDKNQAAESMKPVIDFGEKVMQDGVVGAQLLALEFPSWYTFFDTFASTDSADVGVELALASRLIPSANFSNSTSRSELLTALLKAHEISPGLRFLVSPPTSYKGDGMTSVTEAWRDSIYHITLVETWLWNATVEVKKEKYKGASQAINHLRRITPDAAYSNEADVHEPNHEVSFWGSHYPKLLAIKNKYDPDHLLDCWQCVGWHANSPRFACYI